MHRFAAFGALLAAGCAGPQSLVVAPPCAELVSIDGEPAKGRTAAVNHFIDWPNRERQVQVRYSDGVTVDEVLRSQDQDPMREACGGCFMLVGASSVAFAALDLAGGAPFQGAAGAQLISGSTLLVLGAPLILVGWRPPAEPLPDRCSEHPAPAALEQKQDTAAPAL